MENTEGFDYSDRNFDLILDWKILNRRDGDMVGHLEEITAALQRARTEAADRFHEAYTDGLPFTD